MPRSRLRVPAAAIGTCKSNMLPNGNFELDKSMAATKLIGWAKLKENA